MDATPRERYVFDMLRRRILHTPANARSLQAWLLTVVLAVPVASDAESPRLFLRPESAAPIQALFKAMGPALSFDYIRILEASVEAKVCVAGAAPADCARLELTAPGAACRTLSIGPFCVAYPDGVPSTAIRGAVEAALQKGEVATIWSDAAPPPSAPTGPGPSRPALPLPSPGRPVVLVALLLLGLFVRRSGPRSDRMDYAAALAMLLLAAIWLELTAPPAVIDMVLEGSRECANGGPCYTRGVSSSLLFFNGAMWPALLVSVVQVGGNSITLRLVVVALLSLGVATVFLFTRRFGSRGAAVPAAVLALAMVVGSGVLRIALDTTATFAFAAATAALLYAALAVGRRLELLAGAVFCAHAVCTHVSCAALVPAFLFVAFGGGFKLRDGLMAVATFGATCAATSLAAVATNLNILAMRTDLAAAIVLPTMALIAGAILLKGWVGRLRPVARSWLLLALLVGPFLVGNVLLAALGHPIRPEYFPCVIAPVAVTLAMGLTTFFGSRKATRLGPLLLALALLAISKPIVREGFYGPGDPEDSHSPGGRGYGRWLHPARSHLLAMAEGLSGGRPASVAPRVPLFTLSFSDKSVGGTTFAAVQLFAAFTSLAGFILACRLRPRAESARIVGKAGDEELP